MDNSSYRSQYIRERVAADRMTEESAKELTNVFSRIGRCEEQLGRYIEDSGMTRDDFIAIFENLGIASAYSFAGVKSRIRSYLEWLIEKGYAAPNAETLRKLKFKDIDFKQTFEQKYFKDFQSLQDGITTALDNAARIDDMVFATQIAAIYLAWCGVKVEEAVTLKKADVLEDGIRLKDRVIHPNATIMDFIQKYRDAEGYETQGRGVIFRKYAATDNLLRTPRSGDMTAKDLSNLITKFSQKAKRQEEETDDETFSYAKIYWSGVFHRVYLWECENGTIRKNDTETINRVLREDYDVTAIANMRLNEYIAYREHFFPSAR